LLVILVVQFTGVKNTSAEVTNETPAQAAFNPKNFIITQAQNSRDYTVALSRWQDGNFIVWNRLISQQNDEDLVIAFAEESLNRSVYGSAVTAINKTFLDGNRRTYESSVFLGSLDQAYKSLISIDQEKLNRITGLIKSKSGDFLLEYGALDYLYSRGQNSLADEGLNLVNTVKPEDLTLEKIPAIIQGYVSRLRMDSAAANPFDRLMDAAMQITGESLRINQDKTRVFAVKDNYMDTVLNIRLGRNLLDLAVYANDEAWAGIARSIILSVLSLESYTGTIKAGYQISAEGAVTEDPAAAALSTGLLYRILNLGEYIPRAVALGASPNSGAANLPGSGQTGANPVYIWTAGKDVNVSTNNNIIDISLNFPVGETHYVMVRGLKPFLKVQLYGVDFRSDPQFERYDSSGWSYRAPEQTLLVKMKHRTAEEHIKIFY